MKKNEIVNLDALFVVRKVELDGQVIEVRPIDGVGYQILQSTKESGSGESLLAMYEVAKRCLPNLPPERVAEFSAPQIGALIGIAQSSIEEVEATIPKLNTSKETAPTPST